MDNRKFVCFWNTAPETVETHQFSFFSPDNGYRPDHLEHIDDLMLGESVDLSDGISQTHYVMRVQ